jgi:hypothetical protein
LLVTDSWSTRYTVLVVYNDCWSTIKIVILLDLLSVSTLILKYSSLFCPYLCLQWHLLIRRCIPLILKHPLLCCPYLCLQCHQHSYPTFSFTFFIEILHLCRIGLWCFLVCHVFLRDNDVIDAGQNNGYFVRYLQRFIPLILKHPSLFCPYLCLQCHLLIRRCISPDIKGPLFIVSYLYK